MSETTELHRPLQSGIKITSRRGGPLSTTYVGGGSLGTLATRYDGRKVLVTNLHVMAGITESGGNQFLRNPVGDEKMFQGGDSYAHKVGDLVDWEEVKLGEDNPMEIDAAICTLDENIDPWGDDTLGAVHKLHDFPDHGNRSIIAGTIDPVPGMKVIVLGGETGEITGHVFETIPGPSYFQGSYFTNLFWVALDADTKRGNSGSPVLYKVEDGVYKMVGLHMGRTSERGGAPDPRRGLACRASAIQRILRISFGHNKPIVNAGYTQQARVGELVTLDGSGSDPDNRGDVTFRWKQVFSPPSLVLSEDPVDLSDETDPSPTFTPVKAGDLEFELTVTDVDGLSASAEVTVSVVNRPPVANAGPDQNVVVGGTVTLDASASSDLDEQALTYSWERMSGPAVTLSDATAVSPTFTAPSSVTTLTFRVTVKDSMESTDSDTVTIRVEPETWGSWTDTGKTRGAGIGRQKEQARTSNYGTTETRWVAYPEEEWPDDWQDTGRYRGSLGSREREQERYSNLNNRQTRWISDPEPETWSDWTDTGMERDNGGDPEKEQYRFSNYGNYEYRWVLDSC